MPENSSCTLGQIEMKTMSRFGTLKYYDLTVLDVAYTSVKGVTGNDAVIIQKYLLKIIRSLEPSK